jgi:S-DNA-T family DNA segregation ATPase FtsK/SpoIIIE
MKYFEILKEIDNAIFSYENAIELIEQDYPQDRLTSQQYNIRKERLKKVREKLENSLKNLFNELDIEIKKIRKKQPYFDKNLILQKREIFPKRIIFGRVKISHEIFKDKDKFLPHIVDFPLEKALYSYDEKDLIFAYQYILRVLQVSPLNKIDFILIDPKNIGKSFNFLRPIFNNHFIYNQKVLTVTEEINEAITGLSFYLEYILQKQLSGYKNFKEYNEANPKSLLPLKVLIINGYPEQFDNESLMHLERIVKFGNIGGINTFIFLDKIEDKNQTLKKFEKTILKYGKPIKELEDEYKFNSIKSGLVVEPLPTRENIKSFLEQINEAYKKTSTIKGEIDAFWREDNFWSKSSAYGVSIPIGWDDNEDVVEFEFGYDYSEHHTLIGGRSGSGKSNLVNIIIQNLSYFYSPEEVELYLLDYKEGVEFNSYTNPMLNHASLIAVNSNVSYGVTFLEYIIEEKNRRSELFKKAGVKDFKEYRAKGYSLSKIVIIIDEFQTLFTTKEKDKVEKMFAEILRKGRSFGIHLILSTQTLSGVEVTSLSQLKSQIGNRFALAMGEDDSRNFLSMTNEAAAELKGKPEGIYNNNAGNVSGNKKIYIPFASRRNLEILLNKVSKENIRNQNKIYDGDKLPSMPSMDYFENDKFELILGKEDNFKESDFKIRFFSEFGNNLLFFGKNKLQKQKIIDLILINLMQNKKVNKIYYINSDININVNIEKQSIKIFNEDIEENSFIIIDAFDRLNEIHPKNSFEIGGFNNEKTLADKFKEIVESGYRKNVFTILFVDNFKRLKTNLGDFFSNFNYRIAYNLNSMNVSLLRSATDGNILPPALNGKGIFINDIEDKAMEFKFFN